MTAIRPIKGSLDAKTHNGFYITKKEAVLGIRLCLPLITRHGSVAEVLKRKTYVLRSDACAFNVHTGAMRQTPPTSSIRRSEAAARRAKALMRWNMGIKAPYY